MEPSGETSSPIRQGQRFQTTRWSVVCKARQLDTPSGMEALNQLCRDYYKPLYEFVRRHGHSHEEAEDLTSAFFERLLEKNLLRKADRELGRLRTFLLCSLKYFLINEWNKQHAIRRGGSLTRDEIDPACLPGNLSPDKLYDRDWALTLIERTTKALCQEYTLAREQDWFEALQVVLSEGRRSGSYKTIADQMHTTEDSVRMRVYRMRRRFGELLRQEVAGTVADQAEVEEEMRYLFGLWS